MTGQYSRFVKPGMQRIQADSSDQLVRVTAFKKGSSLVIVAINDDSGAGKSVQFDLSGLGQITSMQPVRTSDTESWQSLAPIAVTGTSFGTTLPSRSVTTFTANFGGSPPPTQTQISINPSPTITIEPTYACLGACPTMNPSPTIFCGAVACTTVSPSQQAATPTPISATPVPTSPTPTQTTQPTSQPPQKPSEDFIQKLFQLFLQLIQLILNLLKGQPK